jgi:hypothetical protein
MVYGVGGLQVASGGENRTLDTPTGISKGAVVGGQYLCDEHLPPDRPAAF